MFRLPIFVYLGTLAVFAYLQVGLIFPGAATQGREDAVVKPRAGAELVHLTTSKGQKVVALFGPALKADGGPNANSGDRPTLIYFYGNAMCLNDAVFDLEHFRELGLNVIIPEYVGYGMSEGSPSETGCRATVDAAYDYLTAVRKINPRRIIAGGWSLGGAVAIDLASRKPVAGLFAFSTFTSAVDLGRRLLPFLPVSLLLRHRFDNLAKLPKITCPILLGHGRLDHIVPFAMAQKNAAAAKGPLTTLWIDQADHNDFYQVGEAKIDAAITRFVAALPPP